MRHRNYDTMEAPHSRSRVKYEAVAVSEDEYQSLGKERDDIDSDNNGHRVKLGAARRFMCPFILAVTVSAVVWLVVSQIANPKDWKDVFKLTSAFDEQADGSIIQVQTLPKHFLPRGSSKGSHNRRLVIVGDVHGCKKELVHLLDKISFNTKRDHLILAGDFIDKGPKSKGVLHLARSLHASCVRGNHEDKILGFRDEIEKSRDLPAGEDEDDTIVARGEKAARKLAAKLSEDDIAWIRQCPLILSLRQIPGFEFKETIVVHAGIVPGVSLKKQNSSDVMHMRSITEMGGIYMPSEDRDVGKPWYKVYNKFQAKLPSEKRTLVVYGHDSKTGLNVRDYTIGLDSGCVRGGKLSALVIDGEGDGSKAGKDIVHVKCKKYK